MGKKYVLREPTWQNYQDSLRNLWNHPLDRLQIYCQPFQLPEGSFHVSAYASCHGIEWIGMERYLAIIEETIPFRILSSKEITALLWQGIRLPTQAIDHHVCVLIDYLNLKPNYFHWFLDALPRIFAAEAYSRMSGESFRIVVPQSLEPWQAASLALLDIPATQLIGLPSRSAHIWNFQRLITSFSHRHVRDSPTGHFDALAPQAIESLSSRLLMGARRFNTPNEFSERVYISRGYVTQRRVANERAVIAFLSRHGFQPIRLDQMPLHQQIQLFNRATHVIAAHGGALTNLMHVSRGCQVLEIFQSGHGIRPDFFQLAALKGALYTFHNAQSINANNDIEIPLDVLHTFLEVSL